MNVDKNPAYPAAVEALKTEGALPRRVRLRQCKYLNNVIEQDHRLVKKRVWLAKGYGSFQSAWRTLQGIETVHMIRKGRVRWLASPRQECGSEVAARPRSGPAAAALPGYRQELYMDNDREPFAVIEWLHTITGIYILRAHGQSQRAGPDQ
jgi:hypothetical protein